MKNSQGVKKKKKVMSQEMLIVSYILVFLLAQRAQKRHSWPRGRCFTPCFFFPPNKDRRKRADSKAPLSLSFSLQPSPFSPHCPEGIWGHSYPKIYRHIKGKKKSPEDPISFIKETAHTRSDDNGANLIPWLLPRTDIMLRNV